MLRELLLSLQEQETGGLFDYSIVIVDNDRCESARQAVESFARQSNISISYDVEPEQNIALARNRAVRRARGDFIAFIDDDEIPNGNWLLRMRGALLKYGVDGILGPVKPLFAVVPPEWAVKAGLFERPGCHETGMRVHWRQTGTGNVLVRRSVLSEVAGPFDQNYGSGGEDQDFFRRATSLGKVFMWCEEGAVNETIPVERTRLKFQIRRALLRGKGSLVNSSGRPWGIMKSTVAFGLYTLLFPAFLIMGRHVFVKYLIKDFDHIGKLLALCGIDLVREKYVTK
jgi:glycosyltransferase involved in cell wall biosynthesis